jgi:methylmalonyl-CoA/ethylmalonyl-CoA epimerase
MASMPASPGLLASVGQIAITVRQLTRATEFYRDTLGLQYLFAAGHMSFFDCDGLRLMLSLSESDATYNSIIYFRCADIASSFTRLSSRGVRFEAEPRMIAKMPDHEVWMAFFRDSEENLLALMCESPLSA